MAGSVQAKDLSFKCMTEEGSASDMGDIHVLVEGIMQKQGDRIKLSYRGEFALGCNEEWGGPDSCWASTEEKYGTTQNQVPYRPRKYKNHLKFPIDLDSDNTYGSFDFIFPNDELRKGKSKFSAHMIMTYINDHWGGTSTLDCEVTKPYKFPKDYVDLKACAKNVKSMASVVNICGDDATFDARSCKQEGLGRNIECRGLTFAPGRGCVMKVTMGPMCEKNISTVITRDERDRM